MKKHLFLIYLFLITSLYLLSSYDADFNVQNPETPSQEFPSNAPPEALRYALSSAESVSMDADLDLTGYVSCAWRSGSGYIYIYLECRRTDSARTLVWSVQVDSDVWGPGSTHTYSDKSISVDTADFPKAVSAGTYYFCARISFIGAWGGLFCKSSSDTTSKGWLEVNSITVTY